MENLKKRKDFLKNKEKINKKMHLFFQELNEEMFERGIINLDNSGSYTYSNYVKNYLDPDNIILFDYDIQVHIKEGLIVNP